MIMSKICDKVALELGWQLQDWVTTSGSCNNGPHWMEKIKDTWHPVCYGDDFMEPDDLQPFLLSAEGRDLLENYVNDKLGCIPIMGHGDYGFTSFYPEDLHGIEWSETPKFSIFKDDKLDINRACLLAFASLTGILTKNVRLTNE